MSSSSYQPWPSRFVLLAALFALPLVLFGGSVTTIGAGMAVEGWLVAEGHFLAFFPVDKWFRDVGTFVEHTHRLWGILVGLCCLAAVLGAWRSKGNVTVAVVALVVVCVQGTLGGLRVEERSPQLAFLHGVFGQMTLATLFACSMVLSRRWVEAKRELDVSPGAAKVVAAFCVVLLGQIVLGALYRHDLRPTPADGAPLKLALHMVGAVGVLGAVIVAAKTLKSEAARLGADALPLARAAKRLHVLYGVQVLLGVLAWVGYRPDAVAPLEWTVSILHVLFGGLFLAQGVCAWLWTRRLADGAAPVGALARGGAA